MPTLRLFASVAEAAGVREAAFDAATVEELLTEAGARYGEEFARHIPHCRIVVNGESVERSGGLSRGLRPQDEVAILPPVAGGAHR